MPGQFLLQTNKNYQAVQGIPMGKLNDLDKRLNTLEKGGGSGGLGETFETVSKNLKGYPYTLGYTGSQLTSIAYNTGTGTITKTLNYTGSQLTSLVLSGATPGGINLTKTLGYTGSQLTGITYA
jgi:hypothetical protein